RLRKSVISSLSGSKRRFAGALPHQWHEDKRDSGEDQPVDRLPARGVQQRTGKEGGTGDRAEDQEVIRSLRLAAFGLAMAVGDHGGRADEAEIPADAQRTKILRRTSA